MAESLGTSVLELDTDDSKLEQGLSNAKGTVKTAAAAIGVAAGAAFTAGAVESIQREALGDKLAAQIALPEAESQRAGDIAGKLYADAYGSSLEEVNAALAGIHTNIGELASFSDSEIEGMAVKALDLASAFDVDVTRATRAAGQMIRNGLAADATEAFDVMTASMQGMDATLREELIDTIEEYAGDFAQLGLSGPQAMGMISEAVQAGARNTDIAADAIREFSIRAIDGSKLTAEGFQALGLDAEEMATKIAAGGPGAQDAMSQVIDALSGMGDKVAQEQAGVALFGTRFEEMGIDAVAALDPVASELDNVDGAAERMGDTLNDNAQTKITAFKRGVEGFLVDIAETPGLVGDAAVAVAGLGQVVQPLGPAMLGVGFIFKDQLLSMATGAASSAASFAVSAAKMIGHWAMMGAQALLHAGKVALAWLIAIGPIALVIAAVVGLVVLIVKNWDTVKSVTIAVFTAVWNFLKGLWDKITGFLGGAVGTIKSLFFRFHPLGIIIANWDPIWDFITGLWNDILGFLGGLPGKISDVASGMWDGIWDAFRSAINSIIGAWNGLSFTLPSAEIFGQTIGGWTLSTPNIPMLADGAIVTRATLAMLGEGGEPEAVIPLDRLDDMLSERPGTHIENLNVEAVGGVFDLGQIEDDVAFRGAF